MPLFLLRWSSYFYKHLGGPEEKANAMSSPGEKAHKNLCKTAPLDKHNVAIYIPRPFPVALQLAQQRWGEAVAINHTVTCTLAVPSASCTADCPGGPAQHCSELPSGREPPRPDLGCLWVSARRTPILPVTDCLAAD